MPEQREKQDPGTFLSGGFRIGRLRGIDVIVHWSLILIFALIAMNIGAGALPIWHPEWSSGLRWVVAIVTALAFFGSIFLHELSHAIVAQLQGIQVPRITLFIFGGVSQLAGEPPTPKAELLIAGVGPLTSILLGFICTTVGLMLAGSPAGAETAAGLMDLIQRSGPVGTILLWLGPINVLLGIFNMIPGFPLDGGRVLRSILWWSTKDLHRATLWAARAGQGVAVILITVGTMMALGIPIPILGVGFVPGLWLALIGWFLYTAARTSYEQVIVRESLENVPVYMVMQRAVASVPPTIDIEAFVRDFVMLTDQQAFPVVEGDTLIGLIKSGDVRKVPHDEWSRVTIAEVMTPASELSTMGPSEDAIDALQELAKRDIDQIPVVDDGHVLGMIRRKDIVKWLGLRHGTGGGPLADAR